MAHYYLVRVLQGKCNSTFRISEFSLPALIDLLLNEMKKGKVKAFSIERSERS